MWYNAEAVLANAPKLMACIKEIKEIEIGCPSWHQ
jgi:hypothetical protein